jgi:hypothetical protein
MRATCESCANPQPVDWRPGDLCSYCGLAVREERRCFWCAKWSPVGKFCRKCGAASVPPEHYGPARMLKAMGASVFEVPKLLAELDPDLIATHQSIYSTHLAVANRHIETAATHAENLYLKHWVAALEDELIPQLPWPDIDHAPTHIPILEDLATLAAIQRGDFDNLRAAASLLHNPNPNLAAEAALQLSGWRALYTTYTEISRHELIALLEKSPLPHHAAPRLAALGAKVETYAATGHPDTDFLILLLEQNPHALEQSLHSADPMRRYAAATQLIRLKQASAIGPTLRAAAEEQQRQLLQDITRTKTAIPAIHNELFAIFDTSTDHRISQSAATAICLARNPADALRLLDISPGNRDLIQVLLRAKFPPNTLWEIGHRLIANGHFNMDHWGWDQAAKPDAMPVSFVPDHYAAASTETRHQLLRFLELQIEAHASPRSPLEQFLIRQCFATAPAELIGTAWAGIHRIQMHRTVGLLVPFDLTLENIQWCWALPKFLTALAGIMAHPQAVQQTFVRDDLDRFLRSASAAFYEAAANFPNECRAIIHAAPKADPYTYCQRFAAELAAASK